MLRSWAKWHGIKVNLCQVLLWSVCICPVLCTVWHKQSPALPWTQGREAPALEQNWACSPSSSTRLLADCEIILWNVTMCQEGYRSEWYRPFHVHNIFIQKKTLCWSSLSTSAHRLGIKMWESPPLVPFSVRNNKMQEDIILPVTHKLLSIEWNIENSLTFRWADKFL